jgi:diaminopimelate decarboxylase
VVQGSEIATEFRTNRGELLIGHCSVSDLVAKFGTPLYVYDGGVIAERFSAVRTAFPSFEVFYSLKANPNLSICRLLCCLGAGAEIASGGELYLALQAGFEPHRIVFAGPGKTEEELDRAIASGIFCIHAESPRELCRIAAITERLRLDMRVALRINPRKEFTDSPEVMAGGSSRFGFDEELPIPGIPALQARGARVIGIHIYTASQILDPRAVIANFAQTLDLACVRAKALGFDLRYIDFGGGFGVPYAPAHKKLDISAVAQAIQTILTSREYAYNLRHTRLILELGRYLVAESGVFLTRVLDVKESRGRKYVITDGGMNQLVRPVFTKLNHPTYLVNKFGAEPVEVVDICGPLCTPFDILASTISVPRAEVGDVVGIFNCGAYGFSMSMLNFLSHPWPAEALVYQGAVYLVRERGTESDFLRGQTHVRFPMACAQSGTHRRAEFEAEKS